MRHLVFQPYIVITVGFDQIAELMDHLFASDGGSTAYPQYNIKKTMDDAYRISIAVAGFSTGDIFVEVKQNAPIIAARKNDTSKGKTYLHRGIAKRAFENGFSLLMICVVRLQARSMACYKRI